MQQERSATAVLSRFLRDITAAVENVRQTPPRDFANVVVQWGPGNAKTVHHVVQSATDFVTIPGPGLTPSNTYRPGTTIGSA